ncbi:hypothetical protein KKB10_01395 [Patescibacteria group bacterium]|nr:hypothetical protein [Patescibacteria group bacterium]MBU1951463.1 hypothetical protein [Patescibacteria group bacterium]
MEEKKTESKESNNKIVMAIIGIVVVILVGWYLYTVLSDNSDDTQTTVNLQEADVLILDGVNENTNTAVVNSDPEAKERDIERVADIEEIRIQLAVYNADKGNYPETLEELVAEGYYEELPVNPTPGGIDYVYTPIGSLPAKFYDLAYLLEAGTDELEAGEHIANPDSIAFP